MRSKNYKKGHKNILGLSVVLESNVKNSTILTFKVIFLCQKSVESLWFFSLKNTNIGDQVLLLKFFDDFNFLMYFVLVIKSEPNPLSLGATPTVQSISHHNVSQESVSKYVWFTLTTMNEHSAWYILLMGVWAGASL